MYMMKAITVRNLPPRLVRAIRLKAQAERTSVNKTVIRLLEEREAPKSPGARRSLHHDLDALAGSWNKKDAATFDRHLRSQRTIDPELWK
jgi:plasmid stability protein